MKVDKFLTVWQAVGEQGGQQTPSYWGYILLTNQRLAFIAEVGIFGKSRRVQEVFELQEIAGVSQVTASNVVVSAKSGTQSVERVFKLVRKPGLGDPSQFYARLQGAIQERLAAIESERRQARVQYVLDFSFLRNRIEQGGISVTSVKCPNCGSPLPLPDRGTSTPCNFCHSQVMAYDVFDKLRGLIGDPP